VQEENIMAYFGDDTCTACGLVKEMNLIHQERICPDCWVKIAQVKEAAFIERVISSPNCTSIIIRILYRLMLATRGKVKPEEFL
jgi:predicted RNA-binding Zn-ribbon protein involved in translation (DUF1610 family)